MNLEQLLKELLVWLKEMAEVSESHANEEKVGSIDRTKHQYAGITYRDAVALVEGAMEHPLSVLGSTKIAELIKSCEVCAESNYAVAQCYPLRSDVRACRLSMGDTYVRIRNRIVWLQSRSPVVIAMMNYLCKLEDENNARAFGSSTPTAREIIQTIRKKFDELSKEHS